MKQGLSLIGRTVLDNCSEDAQGNLQLNMNEHWTKFYRLGYSKQQVEIYAELICINICYDPVSLRTKNESGFRTVIGMMPVSNRTILGIPAQKVG